MARFDPTVAALSGLGLGAGFLYFFDPVSGARRRKTVADQLASAARQLDDAVCATSRDTAHRVHGVVHEAGRRLRHEGPVDDRILEERVRARIGRHVSHPGAIEVTADGGVVSLRGPVLADEVDRLLRAADKVPGVEAVVSELEPHETAEGVPALQGGSRAPGEPWEYWQQNWAPAPRLLAGAVGSGLAAYGAGRRDAIGMAAAAAGLGILLRAVTNRPARRLVGLGGGHDGATWEELGRPAAGTNEAEAAPTPEAMVGTLP